MKKRNLFMSATIVCGLLALAIKFSTDGPVWLWHDTPPVGVILALLSAIFATQWVHYQKRDTPKQLLLMIAGSLLGVSAQAQTNYVANTANSATPPGTYNTLVGPGAGNSLMTGSVNVFVGAGAGQNNSTGAFNTFLGYYAGQSNTVGNYNSFLGFFAGHNNTKGQQNTSVGRYAGFSNQKGSGNVALGAAASYSNVGGSFNVMLGDSAGFNNTASGNMFVGSKAGFTSTTGTYNAFLGTDAGRYNTTGAANVFIGSQAGYKNTTGTYNEFMGLSAGYNNTTGSANLFFGFNSGIVNTTGTYNSFIGSYAGNATTTGVNNVFIGGATGSVNITGSGNTFLGFGADALTGLTSLTNAAAIGANALVAISNAIVLGDTTLSTNVGIGVTAPAYALDVRGTINVRNQGRLKFSQRVDLHADEQEYLVLTAGAEGQSGLRLANLNSASPTAYNTDRFLSVDAEGRVILSRYRVQVSRADEWSDKVFAPAYQLRPLGEVARYVAVNQHLPGVPSAQEMASQGMDAALLNAKLLEKIEELTLYLIAQQNEVAVLRQQVSILIKNNKK